MSLFCRKNQEDSIPYMEPFPEVMAAFEDVPHTPKKRKYNYLNFETYCSFNV